jgi:hypothetical protein
LGKWQEKFGHFEPFFCPDACMFQIYNHWTYSEGISYELYVDTETGKGTVAETTSCNVRTTLKQSPSHGNCSNNHRGYKTYTIYNKKVNQSWTGPEGSRSLKLSDINAVGTRMW